MVYLTFIYEFLTKILNKIQIDSSGNNLSVQDSTALMITVIFALITGILTLVGLLSIFISINSQHNVEKSREILWGLKGEIEDSKIINSIIQYNEISKGNVIFTSKVIRVVRITILFVIITSFLINIVIFNLLSGLQNYILWIITIIVSIIFLAFYYLLGHLKDLARISNLPNVTELLDGSLKNNYGIHAISLAAKTLKVNLDFRGKNQLFLMLRLPFKFQNISFALTSLYLETDKGEKIKLKQPIIVMTNEKKAYSFEAESGINYFCSNFAVDLDKIPDNFNIKMQANLLYVADIINEKHILEKIDRRRLRTHYYNQDYIKLELDKVNVTKNKNVDLNIKIIEDNSQRLSVLEFDKPERIHFIKKLMNKK